MTALLSRNGRSYTLACDGCGQLVTDLAPTMGPWDVAWSLFMQDDWTGDRLATGPHTCGRCSRTSPPPRMVDQALRRGPAAPAGRRSRRLVVARVHDAVVVTLGGDPDLTVNACLRELVLGLEAHVRRLVVDVSRAAKLDSGMLDVLVEAHRQGVAVCMVGASEPIEHALRMLCLQELIPTKPGLASVFVSAEDASATTVATSHQTAHHDKVDTR